MRGIALPACSRCRVFGDFIAEQGGVIAPFLNNHNNNTTMLHYQFLDNAPAHLNDLVLFTPQELSPEHPAIFIVRNGSWRQAPDSPMHAIAGAFAARNYIAAVASYPGNARDALEQLSILRGLYQRFQEELRSLGLSDRIVVLGMDAGGHLGSLLTCAAPGECGEGYSSAQPWVKPVAGCFISTPVQFTPWPEMGSREWAAMQDIAGVPYEEHPEIYEKLSLMNYLEGDVPPLFFADGLEDFVLYPYLGQIAAKKLQDRGIRAQWKGYPIAAGNFLTELNWRPQMELFNHILDFIADATPSAQNGLTAAQATIPMPRAPQCRSYGLYLDTPPHPKRGVDIFLPPKDSPIADTALFMIHGGGWRYGDRCKFHELTAAFAAQGVIAASAGYRQAAPASVFDMLADVREDYDAFVCELERLGRPLKVVIYGESAGAHLASLLAAAAPGECGENCHLTRPWVKPAAMILQSCQAQFFPWPDILPSIWAVMEDIAAVPYAKDHTPYERLSLSTYARQGIPEIFWAEAQFEGIFPHYLNEELGQRLAQMGITTCSKSYTGGEHGFFYDLKRPCQLEFFNDILHYLKGQRDQITGLKTN